MGDFFKSVQNYRLEVKGFEEPVLVSFTMMRKDIVDRLLDKFEVSYRCEESKETKSITFPTILDCVEDFANQAVNSYKSLVDKALVSLREKSHPEDTDYLSIADTLVHAKVTLNLLGRLGTGEYQLNLRGPIWGFLRNPYYNSIIAPRDIILSQIALCSKGEGEIEHLCNLIRDLLKGEFIMSMMETYRKSWYPGFHEGSQSEDLEAYCLLHETILDCLHGQITERSHEDE